MKPLSYTRACGKRKCRGHLYRGETSVQVLQPDTLVRNEDELEADRNYRGYVKSGGLCGRKHSRKEAEIANGATIIVSYKGRYQMKPLSYTVQHVVNGNVETPLQRNIE